MARLAEPELALLAMNLDTSVYSYRAVSAADLLGAHASLAAQLRDLLAGGPVRIATSREE